MDCYPMSPLINVLNSVLSYQNKMIVYQKFLCNMYSSLTQIECVKCINEGNYIFLILCNQQQATDHSLRNTGLYFVPFLWCYILVVNVNGSCNPSQNCAMKAVVYIACLKELKIIFQCCALHLQSFLVHVPQKCACNMCEPR